jgi:hypothetical protein
MLVRWWRSGFLGNMRVPNVRYDILVNTTLNKIPTRMMLVNEREMRYDVRQSRNQGHAYERGGYETIK